MTKNTKVCKDCNRVLRLKEFSRLRRSQDGRSCYCRRCTRPRAQAARRTRKQPKPVRIKAARDPGALSLREQLSGEEYRNNLRSLLEAYGADDHKFMERGQFGPDALSRYGL